MIGAIMGILVVIATATVIGLSICIWLENQKLTTLKQQVKQTQELAAQKADVLLRHTYEITQAKQNIAQMNGMIEAKQKQYQLCEFQLHTEFENQKRKYNEALQRQQQRIQNEISETIYKSDKAKQAYLEIAKQVSDIKNQLTAVKQAEVREKHKQADDTFYRLIPPEEVLDDIRVLERIKPKLHSPRILSMLIWQTYWQPLAKMRFPEILVDGVCGIYKITNIETNECYIGQSVNIDTRWKDHIKCGLGIDTPPKNKLYKAMAEYGINNFTFEVIQLCPKEKLDDREQFYIELYNAEKFGYNGRNQR